MPESSPALIRLQVCAGSVMNRYRWARFVMLIVEMTISGERYKAGKEKPPIGGSVYAVQVAMPEAFHVTLNGVPSPAV